MPARYHERNPFASHLTMSFKYDALPSFEERLCHSLTSNRTTSLALFTTPLPCATKEEPHAAIVEQSRLGNAGETGPQREGCLRIASQAELLVAADVQFSKDLMYIANNR